ncbi:hypothetical protein [Photobacterium leiognathi]|uniref:hypothetical protein n=1 Tax=Photobacterium leiognathi TaxID=553611 RepID=UPI002982A6E1|nr:hypothetical protein [Photobacterium leiognathi]
MALLSLFIVVLVIRYQQKKNFHARLGLIVNFDIYQKHYCASRLRIGIFDVFTDIDK